jgi:metal-sulfur cluster biosynthetic enzyme
MTRQDEVAEALNRIVDPCSATAGTPIGLVDMGIVEAVSVDDGRVSITLLPTFPGCLYTAVFAGEIEQRLDRLGWVEAVEVTVDHGPELWDENRIAPPARARLRADRDRRRRALELTRR